MTFLKKLGQILVKGIGIATGLLPLVQAAVPGSAAVVATVSKDLAEIGQIIVTTEQLGASLGLPGPDKLRAATPQVIQILLTSSLLVGKPIANPALLTQGAQKIADGMVDVLNAVHESAAVEIPPPPAPAA